MNYFKLSIDNVRYFAYSGNIGSTKSQGDSSMPDGDRVHPRLARPYQKVYKQLCEGQFSGESLAAEAVEVVRRQLQQVGDAPANVIAQIASQLAVIPKEPLLREIVDWPMKSQEIEQVVAQAGIPKRIGEYIIEASKELLNDIRTGQITLKADARLMYLMLKRYYRAEFEEHMPMVQHYNHVSQNFVQTRLDEMRPHVEQMLIHLAKQAAKHTSFLRLRRPSRVKPQINLHETDVLALN